MSEISEADAFIERWNTVFAERVFQMPHLATRTLHTTIGMMLRDKIIYYLDDCVDLRNSSIVLQDSGTGKKPTLDFIEEMATELDFICRRRSSITSAGAIGTLCEKKGEILESEGDLKLYDLLTCAEADSILYSRTDEYGNDLLTNLGQSQETKNLISKRLAKGEIKPFISNASLFLTSTVPPILNPRWFHKDIFQRLGVNIKVVPHSVYKEVRDEVIDSLGKKAGSPSGVKELAEHLKNLKIPTEDFVFTSEIRNQIKEKGHLLDKKLEDLNSLKVLEQCKSFTVRRELQMAVYACHHSWLDGRIELNKEDVEYACKVSFESWNDVLNYVGTKASTLETCRNAIINLMSDGKPRSLGDMHKDLPQFNYGNIKQYATVLFEQKLLVRTERGIYQKPT
jgi:hypothetical protein